MWCLPNDYTRIIQYYKYIILIYDYKQKYELKNNCIFLNYMIVWDFYYKR